MIVEDRLRIIDKLEFRRKADYTIWGYLYQFDLALYDLLCQFEGEDLFLYEEMILNPTYEIETVEDYTKYCFNENTENYYLSQVKYSATESTFNHWDVLATLYYNYLFLNKDCNGNINIKTSIFFHSTKEVKISKSDIKTLGKIAIEKKIKEFEEKMGAIEEVAYEDISSYINKLGNSEERSNFIFNKYHNDENLEEFLDKHIVIRWFPEKLELRKKIKEKFMSIFNNNFKEFGEEQSSILYSLGINFIINKWQSKNKRLDKVSFSIDDIKSYIKSIELSQEGVYWNMIEIYIKERIDIVISRIYFYLENKYKIDKSLNINIYKKKFGGFAQDIYEFFIKKLAICDNRYVFLNTLEFNFEYTKEEYKKLSPIKEYSEFIKSKMTMEVFIQRLINIMNYNSEKNLTEDNKLDDIVSFDKDLLQIKLSYDSRQAVLFPKSYVDVLFDYCSIIDKIKKSNLKPKVWFFDSGINKQGKYDYKVNKIGSDSIKVTDTEDNNYYIECMRCLCENNYLNIDDTHWIFCKRCKDGEDKY